MAYSDPEAQKQYQREWLRRRREAWIAANGPCVDCGSTEHLEVDHDDPTSKDPRLKNSSQRLARAVWSWSESRRTAELAKCVVRCHTCHKAKSSKESPKGESTWTAKITEMQALEIIKSTDTQQVTADKYGLTRTHVGKIKRGEKWKHLHTGR